MAKNQLARFTDAEINAEFKRRNQPPPNPMAPTEREPYRLAPESRLWRTMHAKPPSPNTRVRVAFEDETQGTALWTGSGWTDVIPSTGQAFIAWAPLQSKCPAQVRVEEPKA